MGEPTPSGQSAPIPPAPVSGDGLWRWDGERWQPTELQFVSPPAVLPLPAQAPQAEPRIVVTPLILGVSGFAIVAALLVYSLLATNLGLLSTENTRLTGRTRTEQQRIEQLLARIDDLHERWFGDPALWQPAGVPPDAAVHYFDVTGTTQPALIQALNNDGICSQYHCLVDPAVPANSAAWALEIDGVVIPSAPYCYSPRTLSYHFAQHVILMPRWSPVPGSVKITLVQEWNALEGVLLTHEIGHVYVADAYLVSLNQRSQQLPTCQATFTFWSNPHIWDGLDAAQIAYHAKLRANCRPEVGCIPAGWMGW